MLIKVLIVLLSISSWSLMGESSTQISPVETRRAFQTKSCFCFHKSFSHTNINEVIDKNGNGLKRLVVYFYKDIKTNELKMYTPNIEKQRLMPDLAFEGGDYIHDIISGEIFDIFNKNPNVIDTSSVYDKDFDITISKETLSNIGEIEKNPANENSEKESNIHGKTHDSNNSRKIHTNNAISSNENVNSVTDNKYPDLKSQVNSVQGVDKSHSNYYNDQTQNPKICKYKQCGNKQDKLSLGVEKINMSTRPKIEHEYAPHREKNKGKKDSKQKPVKSDHKLLMQKLHGAKNNDIVAKPGGFPLKRLFNKVLSFLTSEADDITKSPQNNKSEDEIAAFTLKEGDYEESEEVEDIEDVTGITYRIIGGRPATGTGALLNNRGKRFSNL